MEKKNISSNETKEPNTYFYLPLSSTQKSFAFDNAMVTTTTCDYRVSEMWEGLEIALSNHWLKEWSLLFKTCSFLVTSLCKKKIFFSDFTQTQWLLATVCIQQIERLQSDHTNLLLQTDGKVKIKKYFAPPSM